MRALVDALRDTVGRADAPVLIDQEGGRVQRLGPPHWRRYPPGRAYGDLAGNDPLLRREIARLGARLIAHDLAALGINVDCVPVLDVPDPAGHEIIGDRAYGQTPDEVALLGRAAAEGLIAGGVLPVIKHIPGHGRAMADSHLELPVVDAPLRGARRPRLRAVPGALRHADGDDRARDLLGDRPRSGPATTSKKVIRRVIRGAIGFDGLVMSDDLSMKALARRLRRARRRRRWPPAATWSCTATATWRR